MTRDYTYCKGSDKYRTQCHRCKRLVTRYIVEEPQLLWYLTPNEVAKRMDCAYFDSTNETIQAVAYTQKEQFWEKGGTDVSESKA